MRYIGSTLLFFGCGSTLLYMIQFEFVIMMWIDIWGESVAWIIRAVMIVLGGILFFMGGGIYGEEGETD